MRNETRDSAAPPRRIIGFHSDDEGHWVADLECGHTQHVRHHPPWINRPWVTTETGRQRMLGYSLRCKRCPEDRQSGRVR